MYFFPGTLVAFLVGVFLGVLKGVYTRWLGGCVSQVLEEALHLLDGVLSPVAFVLVFVSC